MKYRLIAYGLLSFVLVVVPRLALPFSKPEPLHEIYRGQGGGLLALGWLMLSGLWLLGLLILLVFVLIRRRHLIRKVLIELAGFLGILLAAWVLPRAVLGGIEPDRYIAELNGARPPEQFVNPFVGYTMVDCRDLTDEFDVIFVPSHVGIETDFLAYAPRRADKSTGGYKFARKYGDDWYWETTGSQWSNELRNCYQRSKSPRS